MKHKLWHGGYLVTGLVCATCCKKDDVNIYPNPCSDVFLCGCSIK
ncbi:MAG TPA: hypothetical protein VN698_10450 [Bacteroidia bacterium]|nr:hypothetical protein [Bacteroidia bacterium]